MGKMSKSLGPSLVLFLFSLLLESSNATTNLDRPLARYVGHLETSGSEEIFVDTQPAGHSVGSLNLNYFLDRNVKLPTSKMDRTKTEVNMEVYYNVANEQNGQFVVEQLKPRYFFVGGTVSGITFLPIGTEILITNGSADVGYQCVDQIEEQCQTTLLQYCIGEKMSENEIDAMYLVEFLACYYESEHFTAQQFVAGTSFCYEKVLISLTHIPWDSIESCANQSSTMEDYGQLVKWTVEPMRPPMPLTDLNQKPFIRLNGQLSKLAPINVIDAVCLVAYNEECVFEHYPIVSIAYQPMDNTEDGARTFFDTQLEPSLALKLLNITQNRDQIMEQPILVPYLGEPIPCLTDEDLANSDTCWTTAAHHCINNYMVVSPLEMITFVRCTFQKSSNQLSGKERVMACLPESLLTSDLDICVSRYYVTLGIQSDTEIIDSIWQRPTNQTVFPMINGLVNYEAKHHLISELCYNYFVEDDLTYGCRTLRPTVQIFYETESSTMGQFLADNFLPYDKLAPFQDLIQLELVPYGNTRFDAITGEYSCSSENQCHANWIHACLFNQRFNNNPNIEHRYNSLQFLYCTFDSSNPSSTNPVDIAEACINQHFLDGPNLWVSLLGCAHEVNSTLKEEYRKKTEAISLQQIPEVTIDDKMVENSAKNLLLLTICESFTENDGTTPLKPRACFELEQNVELKSQLFSVSIYIDGGAIESRSFILDNVKPILENVGVTETEIFSLRKVIQWQFVPWQFNKKLESGTGSKQDIACPNDNQNNGECLINRVLACVLRQLELEIVQKWHTDQRNSLQMAQFVVCFYEDDQWSTDPLGSANRCVNQVIPNRLDEFGPLWKCVTDQAQLNVLLRMGQIVDQSNPPLTQFPAVVIDQKLETVGDKSLTSTLCQLYKATPLPIDCKNGGISRSNVGPLVNQLIIVLIVAMLSKSYFNYL